MNYAKHIYITRHDPENGRDEPWLEAFTDQEAAVDDAEQESCDVAVYQLVKRYKPKVTRSLI